jgi:hypothetical protein
MKARKQLNLNQWLGQTQERAWLQTQQPDTAQIIREVYDTSLTVTSAQNPVGRTPGLALVAGFNFSGGSVFTTPVIVGTVIFTAYYTFR